MDDQHEVGQPSAEDARRPYLPPRIEDLGDVRDVTMGGSPGNSDSGNPNLTAPLAPP